MVYGTTEQLIEILSQHGQEQYPNGGNCYIFDKGKIDIWL